MFDHSGVPDENPDGSPDENPDGSPDENPDGSPDEQPDRLGRRARTGRPFPYSFTPCSLTSSARAAAGEDVRAMTDDELLERLAQMESARRALDAASAHLAAELDARSVTDRRYGTRTKEYLAAQFNLDPRVAGRLLRAGRALRRLPVADAALVDGAVTFEHVVVLSNVINPRVAHVVEGAQLELVQLAGVLRFDPWARQCRALVDLADADGGHRPSRDERRLSLGWTLDGVLNISGVLVGSDAVAFEQLIEIHANRLFRRDVEDRRQSSDSVLSTRTQLRADALVDLLRLGAAGVASGSGSAPAVEATVLIPVDHPALAGNGSSGSSLPAGSGFLADGDLDLLLCDPVVRALVVDSLGVPLDLGRAVRFATPDQRRALAARDGGCVFPGCGVGHSWTDAHHVVRVADGGFTDLANLALLCRHHHGVVHRNDWHMEHVGGQRFTFTTPRGAVLDSQRHGRLRADSS